MACKNIVSYTMDSIVINNTIARVEMWQNRRIKWPFWL